MRKTICTRCGCPNAVDFVFKILCPEESCAFYDAKLAKEQKETSDLDYMDFVASSDGVVIKSDDADDWDFDIAFLDLDDFDFDD